QSTAALATAPEMVRRGSTVRARQRAPAKDPQTRGFYLLSPLQVVQRDQVWNTQTRNGAVLSSSLTTDERDLLAPLAVGDRLPWKLDREGEPQWLVVVEVMPMLA